MPFFNKVTNANLSANTHKKIAENVTTHPAHDSPVNQTDTYTRLKQVMLFVVGKTASRKTTEKKQKLKMLLVKPM